MALHASCTVRAILMAIHHLQQFMTRHQALVFRKIRDAYGHDHCCVDGRLQVLHQALVTQPRSNEPQSDMLLCKMKCGYGLLLLADVRVHHECHFRRILVFCRTRLFFFLLARRPCSTSCKEAGYLQHSVKPLSRNTRCDVQQTLIQSVHDPPIFGYS